MNNMKTIQQHITERLKLNRDRVHKIKYEYCPETIKELEDIIEDITRKHINDKIIDLNMIDTSKITDMNGLFLENDRNYYISQWDVSHVTNMEGMFAYSKFNQDISNWNVSNVKDMTGMFRESKFNQDISRWDVSQVENMEGIFTDSKFNKDLTPWKSKIKNEKQLKYIQDYIK